MNLKQLSGSRALLNLSTLLDSIKQNCRAVLSSTKLPGRVEYKTSKVLSSGLIDPKKKS